VERFAKKHHFTALADIADKIAEHFERIDQNSNGQADVMMRFICSGLVQYSFFAALRWRIMNAINIPDQRDAAMSNLSNLTRVVFRDDPEGLIPDYVQQVQSGKIKISDPIPSQLDWKYIIRQGVVWQIDTVADGYQAQNKEEMDVLGLMGKTI
jgi:hypothetical protein